jgi:hypothetical protein
MKTQRSAEQGVALITTMIVVAVLAVVAVAFMQSTSTDRLSSRTAVNYVQARLVAEAGASAGEALVARLVKAYPDSVTVWQNIGGGAPAGTNNEATVLYLRAQSADTNLGALPWQSGGAVSLLAHPLVSGASLVPLGSAAASMPFSAGDTNMVNLNLTNAARPRPFVGSRSMTNTGSPVAAAQWVYMGARPGPTNATNPAIARYAFWVEDESFKVNVNFATNGPRGTASLGLNPGEARLDGAWGSSRESGLSGANFSAVITGRDGLPGSNFPTALTAALPGQVSDAASLDDLRFLTTVHSAGLDLSRGGFKRFNINSVTNGITGPGDAANIRTGLDRVLAAITNTNAAPNFGQRFYRATNGTTSTINSSNAVTAAHAGIYLQKLAANLLDYVDNNDQPTVINNDAAFSLRTGRPSYGFDALGGGLDGTNSVAAMGVEAIPRLQEYAIHARIRSLRHTAGNADSFGFVQNTNGGNPTSANFEISLDHYFEFWHPGTNIIRLTNAFLKIYDQPAFGPSGKISGPLGQAGRETSEIPIGNVTFRPGRTVVLTTARGGEVSSGANASQNGFALIDTAKTTDVVSLNVPDADRKFTGTTTAIKQHVYNSQGNYGPSVFAGNTEPYNRLFEVNLLPRSTSITDYQSAVVIGNDNGVLESFVGLPIAASTAGTPAISLCVSNGYIRDGMGNLGAGNNDNVRGGSLRGNSSSTTTPSSTEGDPRALNEQLRFLNYASGMANTDQTRFYSTISSNQLPDGSTMGLPNANYVDPKRWFDVSSTETNASTPTNSPLIVRNGAMQSIGELGHITDPARVAGPGGIELSRGGGRTLRVGQPEHRWWYDTNQNRPSRAWTSWRLADIFTTTTASNSATVTNAQGIPTNSLGVVRGSTNTNGAVVTIPGLINPNGALRDNGAALRAALFGLSFQPLTGTGTLGVPGLAGLAANVTNVSTNLVRRLTTTAGTDLPANSLNPLWERGEISELALLNSGTALAPGVNMSNVFDRGREELVRRSIEMITTRGSVFSVYAIGETLQGTNVTGTARLKQTFEIIPQFPTADAFNDNFALNATRISRRFAPPTNYTVRVLATSYD